jgi:hypothetical protein
VRSDGRLAGTVANRRVDELIPILERLERWGHARGWIGSDPYEGLNAGRLAGPLRRTRRGRQLLIQSVRRSPIDLRPVLRIEPQANSAAIASVVSAYALGDFEEGEKKLAKAASLLEGLRCDDFDKPCWGYPFDVQTRVFFYARGTPNTIATAFAAQALLDAHERLGDRRFLDAAVGAGEFFLEHVPQTETPTGAYVGYLVGDRTPIHNANMLVCALFARLNAATGRREFGDAAERALAYTVARQRSDGSWPYAERRGWDWVDGYHTGYVLDALVVCAKLGLTPSEDAIRRGFDFYLRELFLPDGTPRYRTSSTFPIDVQCVAQGIQTPAFAARLLPHARAQAWRVFDFGRANMLREDGAFVYQRRRLWTNRTPHVRWAAAPMLLALTHLHRLERAE